MTCEKPIAAKMQSFTIDGSNGCPVGAGYKVELAVGSCTFFDKLQKFVLCGRYNRQITLINSDDVAELASRSVNVTVIVSKIAFGPLSAGP